MIAAALPFMFSEPDNVRQFGVGLAIAVVLDALIVRPVLLPAAVHCSAVAAGGRPRSRDVVSRHDRARSAPPVPRRRWLAPAAHRRGRRADGARDSGRLVSGTRPRPSARSPAASRASASSPAIASRSSPERGRSGRSPTSASSGRARPSSRSTTPTRPRSAPTSSRTRACARSSARTPAQLAKLEQVRGAPRARARDPDRPARRRTPSRSPTCARGAASDAARRAPRQVAAGRRGDDHLHVRHDRAAEGLRRSRTRACSPRSRCTSERSSWRFGPLIVDLSSCRSRTRSRASPARGDRRRRHARVLGRRPEADRGRARRDPPDPLPVGPADLREDPHRRAQRRAREPAQARRVPLGAARGHALPRGRARAGARPARLRRLRHRVGRPARALARARAVRRPARVRHVRRRADRRARCSSSSTPAACSSSRATG